MTSTDPRSLRELPIDPRIRMAALWAATTLVVLFVDLFSLYRADVRARIEEGVMFVFDIDQAFLAVITVYGIIPSVMVYLAIALPRRANRIVNVVVAIVFGLTIVGSAVGEGWAYYLIGSAVELVLLALIVRSAMTWRALERSGVENARAVAH